MRYDNYLDDRNDVLRPRKTESKPRPKKANHKHDYVLVEKTTQGYGMPEIGYFSCSSCEKNVTRYL